MRNSVSDVTDAEILDETREAMTQAAFDAADEANAAQAVESATESLPAFEELGLSDEMLRAIESLGYTAPTPVQAGSIPVVLEGRDLLAAAQTGTGKTAAFLLPTMNNLEHIAPPKPVRERGSRNRRRGAKKPEGNGRGPVMLVITPTRELAQQIDEVASKIADVTGHVAVTVVGGVSYKPQTAALKYGCDILVATPGRLVDLIEQGACHLNEVKVLVLDEADRMLDMGFLPAVRRIVRETPAERQTLLFSATLDEEAVGEITDLVSDPARVEIAPATSTADTVDQFVFPVSIEAKNNLLPEFLKKEGPERTIVFMRTKHRADSCCRRLERKGIKAAAIHGNRSQAQRERALSAFRDGTVDVLVATDVLARGIDISELSGDLLTVGMYIGLDYMWDKAKEDLTRRKQIFIDEVWQIIGASSNALAANYVFEAVKTIRGYGGGVLVATQDLNDFFSLEDGKYGRGILNNCKIKIILNLEEEEAQRVQSVLKLTDAEIDNITRFERGSALIVTNSNNVTVDMRCSEEEKDLITTDRDELRRIVERKMQNQTETEES